MLYFHVPRDPFVTTRGSVLRLPVGIRTRSQLSPSHSIAVNLWLAVAWVSLLRFNVAESTAEIM